MSLKTAWVAMRRRAGGLGLSFVSSRYRQLLLATTFVAGLLFAICLGWPHTWSARLRDAELEAYDAAVASSPPHPAASNPSVGIVVYDQGAVDFNTVQMTDNDLALALERLEFLQALRLA